ncbi:hypothetical protein [Devosia sp. Leaf64]|uniref:DUF6953 family protein n=1 Tax=Devosia sp. Leaf64 TaxID=1736229 RepID=UPI0007160A26|nr:hypothetical protein [Devosia sp. Leaf64]KQN74040.1 hypothetical protein ASE94_03270 [Devosia sp. Leaf64]
MTPAQAAQWMVEQLAAKRYLDQETVAWQLHKMDQSLTYSNANGNLAIAKPILAAFNKLTSDGDVVWSRSERQWRYRTKWDKPGRQQD